MEIEKERKKGKEGERGRQRLFVSRTIFGTVSCAHVFFDFHIDMARHYIHCGNLKLTPRFAAEWRWSRIWEFDFVATGNVPAHSSEFEFDTCRRDIDASNSSAWRAISLRTATCFLLCFSFFVIRSMVWDELGGEWRENAKRDQLTWTTTIFRRFVVFFFRSSNDKWLL